MSPSAVAETPLEPDADEAREWAVRELSRPEYEAATPTPIDRMARAVGEFLAGLFSGDAPVGWDLTALVVIAVVLVLVVAGAFLIWGMPRSVHRGRRPVADLFGADDGRTAAELRDEAEKCASADDWTQAVILRFRALARGLAERTVVNPAPGTTVHAFARAAATAFPAHADALEDAASAFDDVRYLRRPGTADLYRLVASVDETLAGTRPLLPVVASGGTR